MRRNQVAVGFILAVSTIGLGLRAQAGDPIEFKGRQYDFTRIQRTTDFPEDLIARLQSPPAAPLDGQEFAIVRFRLKITEGSEAPQVKDAQLFGDGTYPCSSMTTQCDGKRGCTVAFIFYVPKRAALERFELGGMPVELQP
jgi:hypothetical protein